MDGPKGPLPRPFQEPNEFLPWGVYSQTPDVSHMGTFLLPDTVAPVVCEWVKIPANWNNASDILKSNHYFYNEEKWVTEGPKF